MVEQERRAVDERPDEVLCAEYARVGRRRLRGFGREPLILLVLEPDTSSRSLAFCAAVRSPSGVSRSAICSGVSGLPSFGFGSVVTERRNLPIVWLAAADTADRVGL